MYIYVYIYINMYMYKYIHAHDVYFKYCSLAFFQPQKRRYESEDLLNPGETDSVTAQREVVAVIHQPRYDTLQLFDDLILSGFTEGFTECHLESLFWGFEIHRVSLVVGEIVHPHWKSQCISYCIIHENCGKADKHTDVAVACCSRSEQTIRVENLSSKRMVNCCWAGWLSAVSWHMLGQQRLFATQSGTSNSQSGSVLEASWVNLSMVWHSLPTTGHMVLALLAAPGCSRSLPIEVARPAGSVEIWWRTRLVVTFHWEPWEPKASKINPSPLCPIMWFMWDPWFVAHLEGP